MSRPRVNRTGEKYGECVVLGPSDKGGGNGWLWKLRHEPCGREGVSFTATITRPDFTSFEHPCPAKAEQLALKIRSFPGVEDVRTLRHVPRVGWLFRVRFACYYCGCQRVIENYGLEALWWERHKQTKPGTCRRCSKILTKHPRWERHLRRWWKEHGDNLPYLLKRLSRKRSECRAKKLRFNLTPDDFPLSLPEGYEIHRVRGKHYVRDNVIAAPKLVNALVNRVHAAREEELVLAAAYQAAARGRARMADRLFAATGRKPDQFFRLARQQGVSRKRHAR